MQDVEQETDAWKGSSMKRFGIALVMATALGLWAAAPAAAQYNPPTAGVDDSNPSPGGTTTVSGANWCPGSTVDIFFDGNKIATAQVDSNGHFSKEITIPSNASPGQHTITVTGLDFQCEEVRSVNITITIGGAGGAGLAFTGANISVGAVILAALVIVGLAALTAGRRRKATAEK